MNYELYHHGILGMKWGIRRFQNPDGSLTPEGRKRYGIGDKIEEAARSKETSLWVSGKSNKDTISQVIASQVKDYKNDIPEEVIDRLNSKRDSALDLAYKAIENGVEEVNQALRSKEFKKELEEKLYQEFGNGVDDFEYYTLVQNELIDDILASGKYMPNTIKLINQFTNEADKYFDESEKAAQDIIRTIGDQPIIKYKDSQIKYSDVLPYVLRKEEKGLIYLYKNLYDSIMFDQDINMDDSMSFEWYNKKYGNKKE